MKALTENVVNGERRTELESHYLATIVSDKTRITRIQTRVANGS